MFNKGEGGFKARDLYVWCANASDGIVTATPYWNKGKQLRDIEDTRGVPFGGRVMQNATEGTLKETTWWPRPGTDKSLEKDSLLHEDRRSDLQCRLLQGITRRPLCALAPRFDRQVGFR